MSVTTRFTDDLMLRYLLPENVTELLLPAGDPEHKRVRALLTSVYEPKLLDVRKVESVKVVHREFQTSVQEWTAVHASWDKSVPTTEQARATVHVPATPAYQWIDMSLETLVVAKAADTARVLASVDAGEWTAADGHGVQRERFDRAYSLNYTEPSHFDPSAPARGFPLRVSVLFFGGLDLADAMRRLSRARRAVDAASPQPEAYDGGAILASSAWLAVFPAITPDNTSTTTEHMVGDLLATQGFVAAFEAAT
ncbi:hypothetical protein [Streptomyces sp. NPDC058667]|uniref:hypothetical protein n=1 Tax=Streptomyces sp. NPDC058667 TaxID=3346588 RepID=UPI00364B1773